ncbi:hypothetical protein Aperf_G00000013916 [Anoplocephala perfoliata]
MEAFKFRSELLGHTSDVRSICCPRDGLLVSGSRDMSMRTWNIEGDSETFVSGKEYAKHGNYVTAVSFCPPSHIYPNGLILTGSNDNLIRGFIEDEANPALILHGHTGTVCSLDCNPYGIILSGSWDSTARFWNFDSCIGLCSRPGTTIWAVLFLMPSDIHPGEYLVATGSSDSLICIWQIPSDALSRGPPPMEFKTPVKILRGHTDCVRSLALLDSDRLLSSSNDASIRCWSVSSGSCLAEFYGHTSFIYSVAIDPARRFFVSSCEDRTVRVWPIPERSRSEVQQLECLQTIFLPCQTAWCVAVTFESDIAVGCNDGKIRLFSKNPETQASEAAMETYNAELASYQVSAGSLGEIEKHILPGVEALSVPGRSEGEVIVVRESGSLMCYQWSSSAAQWLKVGDVVGSADHSSSGTNRVLYEGKEYDYVFTVDLEDNKAPVKLPYNKTEDPWVVAQAFLYKHDLPQDYLDQVAKFIITQAGLNTTDGPVGGGGGGGFVDPFTEGRYVPSDGFRSSGQAYFPSKEYISIENVGLNMVLNKLKSFNMTAPKPLPESVLQLIGKMNPNMSEGDALSVTESILEAVGQWPSDLAFPLFDLLRCLVRWERSSEAIFQPTAWANLLRTSGLSRVELDVNAAASLSSNELICVLFVFRLMVNAIFYDVGRTSAAHIPSSLPCVFEKTRSLLRKLVDPPAIAAFDKKKHHMVALATLLHNLATVTYLQSGEHSVLSSALPTIRGLTGLCVRMAARLLIFTAAQDTNSALVYPTEVPLRLLIALGTAVVTSIPTPAASMKLTPQMEADLRLRRACLIGNSVPVSKISGAASIEDEALAGWERIAGILRFWQGCKIAQQSLRECADQLLKMLEQ